MESRVEEKSSTSTMKISLKARNVPRLLCIWVLNVVVFLGVAVGFPDVQELDALRGFSSAVVQDPTAGWPYIGLLTLVSVFNGSIPRSLKEWLVFWPNPRPGSRAFSYFMFKDSTINRKALKEQFEPFPTDPDEQNALWAEWLHEFEDDARVRSCYGLYLFARDWLTIAAAMLILAGPIALWLTEGDRQIFLYTLVLVVQCGFARWLGGVQGSQLIMSVMSCKGSSLSTRSKIPKSNGGV